MGLIYIFTVISADISPPCIWETRRSRFVAEIMTKAAINIYWTVSYKNVKITDTCQ